MCGIVGYVGRKPVQSILLESLRRLEYRGYDSAGLCTLNKGHFELRKKKGRIDDLAAVLRKQPAPGCCGIGHTRWEIAAGIAVGIAVAAMVNATLVS